MVPRPMLRPYLLPHSPRICLRSQSSLRSLRFLSASPTSAPPTPSRFRFYGRKAVKYTAFTCLSAVLGVSVVVGAVFIHDVFTYSDRHVDRVPVSPLALHPQNGGPKDLPVASVLVGDDDDGAFIPVKDKPRLVVVGGGWGVRQSPSTHSFS
jgi:hypothetical protein